MTGQRQATEPDVTFPGSFEVPWGWICNLQIRYYLTQEIYPLADDIRGVLFDISRQVLGAIPALPAHLPTFHPYLRPTNGS
eukprot:scaffold9586_cov109-Cylindrotheca_fusiformis.AAC.3